MQNDNDSGRVRRIPIHIEEPNHTDYYQQKERAHHNNHSNQHNTSSVNINYRPPSSNRDTPSPSYQSHQQHQPQPQQTRNQSSASGGGGSTADFNNPNNSKTTGSPEDTESKLINSPEPIPLPPPSSMRNDSPQNNNSANNSTGTQQTNESKTLAAINSIKMEVVSLVNQISLFSGTTAKAKEFRYLEEMLTQCNLKLDNIVCGEDLNLRQQRKAAVKMIDQATDILMKKLQINIDIHNLSQSMTQQS